MGSIITIKLKAVHVAHVVGIQLNILIGPPFATSARHKINIGLLTHVYCNIGLRHDTSCFKL